MKSNRKMKPLSKICFLFFVLFYSQYKSQEDFKFATFKDNLVFFTKKEKNNSGWLKTIEKSIKLKNKKTGKIYDSKELINLQYWKCNCNERTYDITDFIEYDVIGNVTDSGKYVMFNERPIPNTVGDKIFSIFCDEYVVKSVENDEIKELNESIKRFESYSDGFKAGFIEIYCKGIQKEKCKINKINYPTNFELGKTPEEDYSKGYNDGLVNGKKYKK